MEESSKISTNRPNEEPQATEKSGPGRTAAVTISGASSGGWLGGGSGVLQIEPFYLMIVVECPLDKGSLANATTQP